MSTTKIDMEELLKQISQELETFKVDAFAVRPISKAHVEQSITRDIKSLYQLFRICNSGDKVC